MPRPPALTLETPADLLQKLEHDYARAWARPWGSVRRIRLLRHVSRDDAPILLIHGDKDDVVPLEQSEKIEAALRQAEVATKLLRVPGAGHDMRPNPQNVDFVSEMVRWFDNHLRRQ